MPSYAVNAIAIATYKKYALVSLIHNGEPCLLLRPALYVVTQKPFPKCSKWPSGHVAHLPKFTPSAVTRFIKADAQAYTDLASAYSSKKQQDLPVVVEKHQALFIEVYPHAQLQAWYTQHLV